MRVQAWVPYPLETAPGQRYRIEQWAPYLKELGVDVAFQSFASPSLAAALYRSGHWVPKIGGMAAGFARRLSQVLAPGDHDVVFLQREACLVGPAVTERMLRVRRPIVYDFDDAVYLQYVSPTNRYLSYLKFPWKTKTLCRMAAAVMAGNDHLAEYASRYNRRVFVVPSTVSLREYRPRPEFGNAPIPVVGWTGSHSTLQYLSLVREALVALRKRRPFRVLVVGAEGFAVPGLEVECRPWRASTEVRDLWDMDVGVMPLPDEPWARGKCGMKAIQYMGVGVPAVVSPVGANARIVRDGVTGFHASSSEEWVARLDALLGDPELRLRLGRAAYEHVAAAYSAEAHAPRVAEILRAAAR